MAGRPHKTRFLAKKSEPRLAIRNEPEIRHTHMSVGYCELLVADYYRRLDFFLARECEVICGIQSPPLCVIVVCSLFVI